MKGDKGDNLILVALAGAIIIAIVFAGTISPAIDQKLGLPPATQPLRAETEAVEAVVAARPAAVPTDLGQGEGQYRYLTQWVNPTTGKKVEEILVFDCWGDPVVTCSINWGGFLEDQVPLEDLNPPGEWDRYEPTPAALEATPTPVATPAPTATPTARPTATSEAAVEAEGAGAFRYVLVFILGVAVIPLIRLAWRRVTTPKITGRR